MEASANPACLNVTFEVYDAGTAVPTRYLSVADVLSDPILRAVASVVTGAAFGGIGGGRGGAGRGRREGEGDASGTTRRRLADAPLQPRPRPLSLSLGSGGVHPESST